MKCLVKLRYKIMSENAVSVANSHHNFSDTAEEICCQTHEKSVSCTVK